MASKGEDVVECVEKDSHPVEHVSSDRTIFTETDAVYKSAFALDPLEEYNMSHKRRGLALIFNQEMFYWQLRMSPRSGTNTDKLNLIKRFQDLGFEVKAYDDYRRAGILEMITEAAGASHVDADCFVCVFLSHGENGHVYAYDDKIDIQDITALFKGDKCQSLVGKPKIFILQACRGDKHDDPVTPIDMVDNVVDASLTNETVVDAGVMYTLPAGADFLMCYSVAEGFYSHRETVNGSWYIQDLCELLRQHGSKLEFTELLTLINRKVSQRSVGRCNDPAAIGKKQVPCFASMLTKKLYFRPKKGHFLLHSSRYAGTFLKASRQLLHLPPCPSRMCLSSMLYDMTSNESCNAGQESGFCLFLPERVAGSSCYNLRHVCVVMSDAGTFFAL